MSTYHLLNFLRITRLEIQSIKSNTKVILPSIEGLGSIKGISNVVMTDYLEENLGLRTIPIREISRFKPHHLIKLNFFIII